MTVRGPLQLTLALFKPDITRVPYVVKAIQQKIIEEEFFVVRHKEVRLHRDQTEKFYAEHRGKFFYNRLVTFMASFRHTNRVCQVSSCKESLFDDDPHSTCVKHAPCTNKGQFSPCGQCLPLLRCWKSTKNHESFTVLATRLILMKDLRPEGSVYPLWKNPSSRLQWEFPDVPHDWTLLDIHDSSFIDGLLNDVEFIDLT
ncbi:nucleoside diphosphate kinase-like isoform X1 [Macrobrachium nipponense]|uniref:nucleoside diphosphate kinase-like isoform X1 n=1 Tax=Macrobrachium nipponense TaxID=159736 RepID=UPI0030C8A72A